MRTRIERLVTLVLAGVAACGGSQEQPAVVASGDAGKLPTASGGEFTPFGDEDSFACAAPLGPFAPGLRPATAVDYIEVRGPLGSNPSSFEDAGVDPPAESKAGTPCATATDKDACATTLRGARTGGWAEGICGPPMRTESFLVYTRGDTVGTAGTAAEVTALLAPIDSAEEARLVLLATKGVQLRCVDGKPRSGVRQNADGSYEIITTHGGCPSLRTRFRIETSGALSELASQSDGASCACGRRFEGLAGAAGGARHGLGAYFAEVAYLEAASVIAFRRLEAELEALGAPARLVQAAREARADEIRHAATAAELARLHGGRTTPVVAPPARRRSAFAIALENRVEGCVRETFGAVVAAWQARVARDPRIREELGVIARDEAAHAELAHDIAAWLEPLLSSAERAAIDDAASEAFEALYRELGAAPAAEVRALAGVPDVDVARFLLCRMGSLARAA